MPKFDKKENELKDHFEKWLYFLKHLVDFEDIPQILKEPIFEKGFEIAKVAALSKEQYEKYEKSLLNHWEVTSAVDTAFDDGQVKGKAEGKIETAREMLADKVDINTISKYTSLSIEEIEKLI